MDATELGLLCAICENPKEDDPRLRYADWLDENGFAERAEFIRVQVRLAGPFRGCDPICNQETGHGRHCEHNLWDDLRARQQQLLADRHNFVNWTPSVMHTGSRAGIRYETGGTVGLFGNGFESATFTRGFVSHIACTAKDWLAHADAITASQPIERVTLTTWPIVFGRGSRNPASQPIVRSTSRASQAIRVYGFGKRLPVTVSERFIADFRGDLRRFIVEQLFALNWPRIRFTIPQIFGIDAAAAGDIPAGALVTMNPDGTVSAIY